VSRAYDVEADTAAAHAAATELAADVVELRARRLCRADEPHEARAVPCPQHVVEARRQLAEGAT
jgi:hypothetical protein